MKRVNRGHPATPILSGTWQLNSACVAPHAPSFTITCGNQNGGARGVSKVSGTVPDILRRSARCSKGVMVLG